MVVFSLKDHIEHGQDANEMDGCLWSDYESSIALPFQDHYSLKDHIKHGQDTSEMDGCLWSYYENSIALPFQDHME